jgi:OmpA-OmpF porin, OOP family
MRANLRPIGHTILEAIGFPETFLGNVTLVPLPVCERPSAPAAILENKMELAMMHKKFALLSFVAAVAVTPFAGQAQSMDENAYVSFGGGATMPGNSSVDYRNPAMAGGAAVNGQTNFDTGYIFSGAMGYRWGSGMRTELEFNHRKASIDSIAGADAPGKQRVWGLMGNVLFDITDIGSFRPYVGGGAGVGWAKWSNVSGGASPTFPVGTAVYNDKDTAFQWQGIAGVTRPFTDRVDGFVEYRYIGLERAKFQGAAPGVTASRHNDRSHNMMIGARYNF